MGASGALIVAARDTRAVGFDRTAFAADSVVQYRPDAAGAPLLDRKILAIETGWKKEVDALVVPVGASAAAADMRIDSLDLEVAETSGHCLNSRTKGTQREETRIRTMLMMKGFVDGRARRTPSSGLM